MVRFAGIRLGFLAYFSISGTQSFWKIRSWGTCAVVSEQPRHQRQWDIWENSRFESNWEDGDLLVSCNLLEMPDEAGVVIAQNRHDHHQQHDYHHHRYHHHHHYHHQQHYMNRRTIIICREGGVGIQWNSQQMASAYAK